LRRLNFEVFLTSIFVFTFLLKFLFLIKISNNIFFTEDALQIEYWFKLISETNMFGIEHRIANPVGDSIWSNPSLGVAISSSAFVLQDIFNLGTAQTVLAVFFLVGIANFTSTLYLAKVLNLNYLLTSFMAFAIGLSPYYFEKVGAVGVAAFYPLIIFISYLIKYQRIEIAFSIKNFIFLFIVILTSSFWWLIVLLVVLTSIVGVYFLPSIINKSFDNSFLYVLKVYGFVITSLIIFYTISLNYSYLRGENRFQPWQSEIFSGKISNFILYSPFIETIAPISTTNLSGGISPGAFLDQVGFIPGLSIIFLFALFFLSFTKFDNPLDNKTWFKPLLLVGLVSTFFYVSGGFGNLLSGLFVLLEQTSPIRSWSRLNILMGIIGLVFMLVIVQIKFSRRIQSIFLFLGSIIIIADLYYSDLPDTSYIDKSSEKVVSEYLVNNVSMCKVIQIPVDTQPIPQDYINEQKGKFYYTNYKQYLLNPNLNWSYGNWTHSEGWVYEASIPTEVNQQWLNSSKENICAVIYDKEYADWRSREAVEWPGLKINLGEPSFVNQRYDVYLIKRF